MEHQRQLAAILETAVDSIIVIDRAGLIQSVNPATERMFGYAPDELITHNVSILMPSPYRQQHDQYLEQYHNTGQRKIIGIGREVIGRRKNGTVFPIHVAVSEIELGDRKLFTGIIRDITDLKEAQRRLTEMNEVLEERVEQRTAELSRTQADLLRAEKLATLGQISGSIAHEIRNPLNVVKTSAYFLLNAVNPSDEKIREHLQRIDKQVTSIDNVITVLSDVARQPDPKLCACDIGKAAIRAAEEVTMKPSIKVEFDFASDLPQVMVDPQQIPIVLRNLILNARDAMPDGGTLSLGATIRGNQIAVYVTDTGEGIEEERLDQITEPLYSTKAHGMGLGLAISNAIVQKNRGTLEVQSELGKGTKFSVVLLAADANSQSCEQ